MIVHCAISDELYLRHARDRLEVWMEDGLFGRLGLVIPMSISLGRWVKCLWNVNVTGVSASMVSGDERGPGVHAGV